MVDLKCIFSLLRARKVFIVWQRMAYSSSPRTSIYQSTGETLRQAFLSTVSTGEAGTSSSTPALDLELHLFERSARTGIVGLPYRVWILISHFLSNKPFLVCEIQGRYSLQRRLVRTMGGRLGLVGADCRVGDAVVLGRGGSVPLVLRKRVRERGMGEEGEGIEEWELVGDA